jgi:hypothetical protein
MDFIFNDEDATVVRFADCQIVGVLKFNVVDIALELGHQVSPPPNNARPTRKLIEDLIDNVVRDDIEEMITFDVVA